MRLTGLRPEVRDNGHPPEVDDVVTEKENETENDKEKIGQREKHIDSIDFVFKLPTPIDLDRYPAIEFACTHKKERKL